MAKKKLRINRILILCIPVLMASYVLFTINEQRLEMNQLKRQEASYIERINTALKEIEEIKGKIEGADEEDFIEKIARQQLKMVGSDEIIFIDMGKGGK